jgi:hypothetical protein
MDFNDATRWITSRFVVRKRYELGEVNPQKVIYFLSQGNQVTSNRNADWSKDAGKAGGSVVACGRSSIEYGLPRS